MSVLAASGIWTYIVFGPVALLMIMSVLSGVLEPFIGSKPAYKVIEALTKAAGMLTVVVLLGAFCVLSYKMITLSGSVSA